MSNQMLHYVHSKKDPVNNEEERNKWMDKFYPEASYKRDGPHRHLSNSEVMHHDRGNNVHLDNAPPRQPTHGANIMKRKLSQQGVDPRFKVYPMISDSLKYKIMKPGTNSIVRPDSEFVAKYPYGQYMTPQEIYEQYNSKKSVNLERQERLFKYTEEGEFLLIDKDVLESQRGVITDVIKQATMNLMKGKGLMRVQLPIRLFEPICAYEVISRFTGFINKLHDAAAAKPGIERLKHVMSWIVGGFVQAVAVKKPFNNIIGETMNGEYPDGTKIYAEHINHDPPIEALLMINEEKKLRFHANLETVITLGPNEAIIGLKGVVTMEFGDDIIYFQLAPVINRGLLMGNLRVCSGEAFYFYYPGHELKGLVGVGDKTFQDSLYGGIYWSSPDIPIDDGMKKDLFPSLKSKHLAKEKLISTVGGRLFQNIMFDQKVYWHKDMLAAPLHISERVLPSDWLFRDDIMWLKRGNPELSMKWKTHLEDVNREWRKAKEAFRKKNKHLFK